MLESGLAAGYAECMNTPQEFVWDDRSPSFRIVGDISESVARLHSGVSIDSTTHERWRQLMSLLRDFDTWVDDSGVTVDEAIERLESFDDLEEIYPALAPGEMEQEARDLLLQRTRKILRLGQFASRAETPYRFTCLRVEEGRQSARLLADSATPEVLSQPKFASSFIPTMESLSIGACTVDSIADARGDYKQEKMDMKPNQEYYRLLTGATLSHAMLGARALMHPEVAKELGTWAAVRFRVRIARG